jgi:20S proteasome subunit beta 5
MGPTIASNEVQKVIPVNPYVLSTLAGGAADCVYWLRELSTRTNYFELHHKRRASVAFASKAFAETMRSYLGMGLSVASLMGGYDDSGPDLYMVTSEAERIRGHLFSVGSGSSFAIGVMEANYRADLPRDAAIALGQAAIFHAQVRDGMSGGFNQVYFIDENGWERIERIDAKDLQERFRLYFTEMDPFTDLD